MAMGRRKTLQSHLFLPTARGVGHRFYEALDKLLVEADFDKKVEALCEPHYATSDKPGRPSVPPGLYFRMMLVGFFENVASERGIAWRCADSMSLRDFLGLAAHVAVPDASTVSRTRRRLPADVFDEVFRLVLGIVDSKGLLKGRVRGVDSTYLKADASMRSIVRKDTGEDYRTYIKRVAAEAEAEAEATVEGPPESTKPRDDDDSSGGACDTSSEGEAAADTVAPAAAVEPRKISTEEAVRHDRRRRKTTSNQDWSSSSDEDARIARMKDGTTRLAYKPEHVVDMETGVVLAVEVHAGDAHDASTIRSTLAAAAAHIEAVRGPRDEVKGESWHNERVEVVADKGYHKVDTLLALKNDGYRTFIPERKQRGQRKFVDKGGAPASKAFHENRARTRRSKGKALQRRRGELLERPNQHLYDRGGLRKLPLTGRVEVSKRVCLEAIAFNLAAVMRKTLGAGTPKWLAAAFAAALVALWAAIVDVLGLALGLETNQQRRSWDRPRPLWCRRWSEIGLSTAAC